ncbi:hypothetical protein U1Q18_044900 [Sarracenia purpurea var. burkii]
MRFKKQKRHRKIVKFYTACFGFREPFKVLCDGTFVHHLLVNHITPVDSALSNILGATVKIFTTRCVLAELKSLGESYSESLEAARNLITARCDHEKRKSAVACIQEIVGEDNHEHFFVSTQDADLRKKLHEANLFISSETKLVTYILMHVIVINVYASESESETDGDDSDFPYTSCSPPFSPDRPLDLQPQQSLGCFMFTDNDFPPLDDPLRKLSVVELTKSSSLLPEMPMVRLNP